MLQGSLETSRSFICDIFCPRPESCDCIKKETRDRSYVEGKVIGYK